MAYGEGFFVGERMAGRRGSINNLETIVTGK